jgi:hypothetical protein
MTGGSPPSGDTRDISPRFNAEARVAACSTSSRRLGTTPSQSMVVIGTMAAQLVCRPPANATGRSGEDGRVVRLQLVEAEKRALDLIEARGLVPLRHGLVAREPKQVLVLGPVGERLPLADGGQIQAVHPLARRAEHSRRIAHSKSGVSNSDAVTSCAETGT